MPDSDLKGKKEKSSAIQNALLFAWPIILLPHWQQTWQMAWDWNVTCSHKHIHQSVHYLFRLRAFKPDKDGSTFLSSCAFISVKNKSRSLGVISIPSAFVAGKKKTCLIRKLLKSVHLIAELLSYSSSEARSNKFTFHNTTQQWCPSRLIYYTEVFLIHFNWHLEDFKSEAVNEDILACSEWYNRWLVWICCPPSSQGQSHLPSVILI